MDYQQNDLNGREIGWEETIENDSSFTLLPEGDYRFVVTKFERGRHNGSDKLPPCNKAVLTLQVSNGQQSTLIEHQLFLHTKTEGMLCEFFTAIGQRKHGERLAPRWNEVIGAKGTCKVYINTWKGRDGQDMQSNRIKKFYAPEETPASAAPAAPDAPAQSWKNYQPGKF